MAQGLSLSDFASMYSRPDVNEATRIAQKGIGDVAQGFRDREQKRATGVQESMQARKQTEVERATGAQEAFEREQEDSRQAELQRRVQRGSLKRAIDLQQKGEVAGALATAEQSGVELAKVPPEQLAAMYAKSQAESADAEKQYRTRQADEKTKLDEEWLAASNAKLQSSLDAAYDESGKTSAKAGSKADTDLKADLSGFIGILASRGEADEQQDARRQPTSMEMGMGALQAPPGPDRRPVMRQGQPQQRPSPQAQPQALGPAPAMTPQPGSPFMPGVPMQPPMVAQVQPQIAPQAAPGAPMAQPMGPQAQAMDMAMSSPMASPTALQFGGAGGPLIDPARRKEIKIREEQQIAQRIVDNMAKNAPSYEQRAYAAAGEIIQDAVRITGSAQAGLEKVIGDTSKLQMDRALSKEGQEARVRAARATAGRSDLNIDDRRVREGRKRAEDVVADAGGIKQMQALQGLSKVPELLRQEGADAVTAHEAARTIMARLRGEKGAMSEGDIRRSTGTFGAYETVGNWLSKLEKGGLSKTQRTAMAKEVEIMIESTERQVQSSYDHAQRAYDTARAQSAKHGQGAESYILDTFDVSRDPYLKFLKRRKAGSSGGGKESKMGAKYGY